LPKSPSKPQIAKSDSAPRPTGFFRRLARLLRTLLLVGLGVGLLAAYGMYRHIAPELPDVEGLRDVRYQMPMSVYTRDGLLIAQFGEKKHTPLPIDEIPNQTVQAFLAAEDDRFFDHPGVDYQGLLRATFKFLRTGTKRQGGSTITMQVARNFFLSSEKTFFRKLKEILLAIKIESRLPKRQILELYLNKIYFGHHAYGLAAAAQVYYGKTVSELTLGETAMIAGLPKAPSSFNPIANPERALIRRNYVLKRMRKLNFIDDRQYESALAEPVHAALHAPQIEFSAPYVAEIVRAELFKQYGEDAYSNGYKVYTTVDSRLQNAAQNAVRATLHEYDERHGYRGVKRHHDLKKFKSEKDWDGLLADIPAVGDTLPAIVLSVTDKGAETYLGQARRASLDWEQIKWARKFITEDSQGPAPRSTREVLKAGDVIRVREKAPGVWTLTQTPAVEGALASLNPSNGAVLALAGGYDFADSKFNRATQAQRQPGSGFKPILYAAAMEADIAGQRHQQMQRPEHRVAVEPMVDPGPGDDGRRPGRRQVASQGGYGRRGYAGDPCRLRRGVSRQGLAQQVHDRANLDILPVLVADREAALDRRPDRTQEQGPFRK